MARTRRDMTQVPEAASPAVGRPRDPETEQRILETALQLLRSEGYSRMSVDAVAAEAGVSKPTIYRRWPSKADLATAAIRTLQLREPPFETGSVEGDLLQAVENFRRSLFRPNGMSLIGTVLAEEAHTPELIRLFRERIVTPRRAMLRGILERGKESGAVRMDADLDAAVNLLVGAFYARYLSDSRVPERFARDAVAIVWAGIRASKARSGGKPGRATASTK